MHNKMQYDIKVSIAIKTTLNSIVSVTVGPGPRMPMYASGPALAKDGVRTHI